MPHTITVLHVPDCAGGAFALAIASRIVEARDDVSVEDVVIEDEALGVARGFRGSPTVQIDGVDLEPETEIPLGTMGRRRYLVPGAGIDDHPSEAQMLERIDGSD